MEIEDIKQKARSLDIPLSEEKASLFQKYLFYLLRENKKYNLTSITDKMSIVEENFLEPLTYAFKRNMFVKKELLDLGSGAGFPGVPLKIFFPHLKLYLVDSSRKKIAFLRFLVRELELENVFLLQQRAEELGQSENRESFEWVTVRALAPLVVTAELALPLLKVGGCLNVFKGPAYQEELKSAQKVLSACGGRLVETYHDSSGSDKTRIILVIEKVSPSESRYPRRPGIPQKRPFM